METHPNAPNVPNANARSTSVLILALVLVIVVGFGQFLNQVVIVLAPDDQGGSVDGAKGRFGALGRRPHRRVGPHHTGGPLRLR